MRPAAAVPALRWLPRYRRAWLAPDLLAGLVVASVAIPTALGYAGIADVPVQVGLYALPGALIAYAALGSSRQVSIGPSSTVALMSGALVVGAGVGADPARAVALSAAMAVAAGLLLVVAGALRLGWATDFLSRPVITGFTFGLAVTAIAGELPHLLGVGDEPQTFVPRITETLSDIGSTDWRATAIGSLCLAVLFIGTRFAPRVPWALVVMIVAIVVSSLTEPATHGIEVIGPVPQGLPGLGLPAVGWADLGQVVVGGMALAVVGVGEGLSAARIFAARGGYRISADQEFVGSGAANVAAGLSGGLAVCGSLSRTASAVRAGARTQVSGLVAAVVVVVVLVRFTGTLSSMPRVVLSAIVVQAVWFLMDVPALRRYRRVRRNDFNAAVAALIGVLLAGPLYGLLFAVLLSVLGLTYRSSRQVVDVLGRIPDEMAAWGDVDGHPERTEVPGVLVLRLSSPVFWANGAATATAVLARVDAAEGVRAVVLDLEATGQLDTTAADQLESLLAELRAAGVQLYLARVMYRASTVMAASGFLADLGEGRSWHSISQAVAAACERLGIEDGSAAD